MIQLNKQTRDYISQHKDDDVRYLALHPGNCEDVDLSMALRQIEGRQIALRKLPSLASVEGLVYPPHISMEQCSSEQTARYKASLVSGGLLVDLTGGFGIDFVFLCHSFSSAIYVEQQELLCDIATHNFSLLDLKHVAVRHEQASSALSVIASADCIYLDPARRDQYGRKVVSIADCEPNLSELLPALLAKSQRVMVKYSPMLDLSLALSLLTNVAEVHVVAVNNECKELLFLFDAAQKEVDLRIVCVNLKREGNSVFCYTKSEESSSACSFADEMGKYLYEPNVALMKGGAYKLLTQRYAVQKLDVNTHLYTSNELVADFPGRVFFVDALFSMSKSDLKEHLAGEKMANVVVRNFPQSAAQVRERLKLKEGGELFLFATTLAGRKVMIKGRRIE